MPDLFSEFALKGVTLRNRIGMSPMTMYRSVDGTFGDFHVMYLGARAAGGFGLVFPEQVAVVPEGRTSVGCAGIYDDAQVEGHARVASVIKQAGAVPGIQLGHTGRKGSRTAPWHGKQQLSPTEPGGWQCVGPSEVPYGGSYAAPVHSLTVPEITRLREAYARAARRAADAGYEWLELHFAHGYLGSSFLSPLANRRVDAYGGDPERRVRFCLEVIEAVRAVWPEQLPLTVRLGCDDLHPDGIQFEESLEAAARMVEHGIDLVDPSLGGNTDAMVDPPFDRPGFMLGRAERIRSQLGVPVASSWNLGVPSIADAAVRRGHVDLVLLGRPALANAHWPVWAARELGHPDPFSLLPPDWSWYLRDYRGHAASVGWPAGSPPQLAQEGGGTQLR